MRNSHFLHYGVRRVVWYCHYTLSILGEGPYFKNIRRSGAHKWLFGLSPSPATQQIGKWHSRATIRLRYLTSQFVRLIFRWCSYLSHMTRPIARSLKRRHATSPTAATKRSGCWTGPWKNHLPCLATFPSPDLLDMSKLKRSSLPKGPAPPPPKPHFYIAVGLIAMSCGVREDICVSDNMLTVITTHNWLTFPHSSLAAGHAW